MKKTIIFGSIGVALIAVLAWFGAKNSKNPIEYETEQAFKTNIVRKTVATCKVVPLEEAAIKPKVSGISIVCPVCHRNPVCLMQPVHQL